MSFITIGILAWNEENSIGATLRSLGSQTLLTQTDRLALTVEVVVVANGCTDQTAQAADLALDQWVRPSPRVTARVEDLAQGGKSRAWNELVHRLASPSTDYFILMDADIELLGEGTLECLWSKLAETPTAAVSTDQPVKHISRQAKLSWRDRILIGAGSMTRNAPGQLTGQLYCARAAVLREIWIPQGIIVEDGYLKQMISTDGFSQPINNDRIVRAEGARHVFECYTRWGDIWNHQIRQAAGHTLYTFLTAYLRREVVETPVYSAVATRCQEDPDWFGRVVAEEIERRGYWVMDRKSFWVRWRRLRYGKGMERLRFLVLALLATPFDLLVFMAANRRLKRGHFASLWRDTRTTQLS